MLEGLRQNSEVDILNRQEKNIGKQFMQRHIDGNKCASVQTQPTTRPKNNCHIRLYYGMAGNEAG